MDLIDRVRVETRLAELSQEAVRVMAAILNSPDDVTLHNKRKMIQREIHDLIELHKAYVHHCQEVDLDDMRV
jgi:hypothetical protein